MSEDATIKPASIIEIPASMIETISVARELLEQPDGAGQYDLRNVLKILYLIHDYDIKGNRPVGTYDCGSARLENTTNSLYRALFLFRPERLSFKSMYKTELLTLVSPDYSLVASLGFYKYELALYFSASKENLAGRESNIICGLPGSDNGVTYKGAVASAWFGLLKDVLNHKWMIYGGNDFEV